MDKKINEYIIIKESKIHHKGVFALKDIPKGTKIIEYIGEIISKEEGTRREKLSDELSRTDHTKAGTYIFEIDEEHDLDGDITENHARYINHSCNPNCESDIIDKKIWVIVTRDIKEDEELSYDYGFAFDEESFNYPCKCGAKNCVGYIVRQEDWLQLTEAIEKRQKIKPINQFYRKSLC